ncbi:MAG: hypothetical protein WAL36_17265, partial [Pseudolabrys sp.]
MRILLDATIAEAVAASKPRSAGIIEISTSSFKRDFANCSLRKPETPKLNAIVADQSWCRLTQIKSLGPNRAS